MLLWQCQLRRNWCMVGRRPPAFLATLALPEVENNVLCQAFTEGEVTCPMPNTHCLLSSSQQFLGENAFQHWAIEENWALVPCELRHKSHSRVSGALLLPPFRNSYFSNFSYSEVSQTRRHLLTLTPQRVTPRVHLPSSHFRSQIPRWWPWKLSCQQDLAYGVESASASLHDSSGGNKAHSQFPSSQQ